MMMYGPALAPVCHDSLSPVPDDEGCDVDSGCDSAHDDCGDDGARSGDVHHVFSSVSPLVDVWPLYAGTHRGVPCTLHKADDRKVQVVAHAYHLHKMSFFLYVICLNDLYMNYILQV